MAVADLYEPILVAAQAIVANLTLTGLDPANVRGLEMPVVRAQIDATPCVLIAPSETAERVIPLSFEDQSAFQVDFSVDIVIVARDNQDFRNNRATYLGWRSQIEVAFQPATYPSAPTSLPLGQWDTTIRPWQPVSRALLQKNYAYLGSTIVFSAVRARS